MKYYVIYFDFEIQKSNIYFSGQFGEYHYLISNDKLSVIYPQKKNRKRNIGYHFKLDANFYGLISLISLAFELRCSTSRMGSAFKNSPQFDKLLKKETEYSELFTRLRTLDFLSSLQADHTTLGFKSDSVETFNESHLFLAENIVSDLTRRIQDSSQKIRLFTQLDYWRRGFDLSELNYNAEGFLNYFKIYEHILKDHPGRKLQDDYVKQELKKIGLSRIAKKVCFYRDLRNKFNIAHYVPFAPEKDDYDEYLSNMSDRIWNHESDVAQVAKLLILRSVGCQEYYLKEDGGLYFVDKQS